MARERRCPYKNNMREGGREGEGEEGVRGEGDRGKEAESRDIGGETYERRWEKTRRTDRGLETERRDGGEET